MVIAVLRGRIVGWALRPGRMVRHVEEAGVDSAGVDFRPGVDGALYHDGGGCLAGVAAGWLGQTAQAAAHLPRATGAQRTLNAAVLRLAPARCGVCRDRAALAGNCHDTDGLSAREPRRCLAACALPCVGEFRRSVKLHFVATEPLTFEAQMTSTLTSRDCLPRSR